MACISAGADSAIEKGTTVIVQLTDDATSEKLETEFKTYRLKQREVLSRPLKIVLFDFDHKKIEDTDLVTLLKKSALVKEAQPNREVQPRN